MKRMLKKLLNHGGAMITFNRIMQDIMDPKLRVRVGGEKNA